MYEIKVKICDESELYDPFDPDRVLCGMGGGEYLDRRETPDAHAAPQTDQTDRDKGTVYGAGE